MEIIGIMGIMLKGSVLLILAGIGVAVITIIIVGIIISPFVLIINAIEIFTNRTKNE